MCNDVESKKKTKILLFHEKAVPLHRILQNNKLIIKFKYESIRNRFHFDSRFV